MSSLTEKLHASGFIISEQDVTLSRDNAVLISGQNLGAGTVLGKKATAGTATGAADAGNTGTSTIGTVTAGGGAKPGVYAIVMVGAGATAPFEVEDPDGVQIGDGKIGTAFAGDVGFTITNVGGTTVAGDRYTVTVSQLTHQVHDSRAGGHRRHAARGRHPDRGRRRVRRRPALRGAHAAGRGELERAGVARRHHRRAEGHRARPAPEARHRLALSPHPASKRPSSKSTSQEDKKMNKKLPQLITAVLLAAYFGWPRPASSSRPSPSTA
jgi:hypothetical protein